MNTHAGNNRTLWAAPVALLLIVPFGIFPYFASGQDRKAAIAPELLIVNAHVITMARAKPRAEAIAIQGESIAWVGSGEEAKKLFPATARVIDLHGATVLPGIIDAHTHLMSLGESFLKLNLKDAPTQAKVVELVRQKASSAQPGEWILGWGWDEGKWSAPYPTNKKLNEAAPNNPVYLVGLHTFASWANKNALQIAGITKDTPDPDQGKILRDEKTGDPSGVLLNRAQQLVEKHVSPMTLAQVKHALQRAAQECVRHGLTSVHEAKVSAIMVQAFRELVNEGRMPVRVYAMLDGADRGLVNEWLERGPEIDPHHQLTIRAFKLFADGALGSRGAALLEPYSDAPQTNGVITTPEADVYQLTGSSLQRGFQVCTHAIGDRANRMVLDAYTAALKDVPQAHDPRLRIEHAQVLTPEDVPRFAKLGVIVSMQPAHATSDMAWAEARLGPRRIKGAYAWQSVLKTGAHLPLSSDFPGETMNPFYGIYAAITRQDPQGYPPDGWYSEQRLTLNEALRGYTMEGAYAEFEEKAKGSIEPGKLADVTVISEDITKLPPRQILNIRVLKTLVGGRVVYDTDAAK
jgi:predicted amidohydrolase YtcJ